MRTTVIVLVLQGDERPEPAELAKPVIETTGDVVRARPIRRAAARPHRNYTFDVALGQLARWLARVA